MRELARPRSHCVPQSVKTYFPKLALTEVACSLTVGGNPPMLVCPKGAECGLAAAEVIDIH